MSAHSDQLGFGDFLAEAAEANAARQFNKETAHLPRTMAEAITCHRKQIQNYHAAMLACELDAAAVLERDARQLAQKLNGGKPGILASDNAPGCVLTRETAAPDGQPPLWGQAGRFDVTCAGLTAHVEIEGLSGIGMGSGSIASFSVRANDPSKPFLSSTGYRSFLGMRAMPDVGTTPETYVRRILEAFVAHELKGRLVQIRPPSPSRKGT